MKSLVLSGKAIKDINKARNWYNKQQHGLGIKFAEYIFVCFEEIQKRPLAYPCKYEYTKEMVVKKYPYLVQPQKV